MKITLLATAALPNGAIDTPPTVTGEVLHYRGFECDLSPLGEGEEIEIGPPFAGAVVRKNNQVELQLEYLFDSTTAESNQSAELADYTFVVEAGQCPCPIVRKPVVPDSTPDPEPESVAESEAEVFPA